MTIATSARAARYGSGIPAIACSTRRWNRSWIGAAGARGAAVRAPRRRFGMAAYRSHVTSAEDPAMETTPDLAIEPAGYVVLVEPGDRIHFLEWGGEGRPGIVM